MQSEPVKIIKSKCGICFREYLFKLKDYPYFCRQSHRQLGNLNSQQFYQYLRNNQFEQVTINIFKYEGVDKITILFNLLINQPSMLRKKLKLGEYSKLLMLHERIRIQSQH